MSSGIPIKRLLAIFAGGNIISFAMRLVGGLLAARLVSPETLGLFNGLSLAMGYVPFLQLGVINGLNRELPYYIGLGDKEKALTLTACAQSWSLLVSCFAAGILIIFALWEFIHGRFELGIGWLTQAWLAFQLVFAQLYLQVTYRTGGDFSKLTVSNVIQQTVSVALVVVIWLYGFYGLCIRAAIVAAVGLYTLWVWRPVKVSSLWDKESFKHLLKIGVPIIAVGQVYAWWATLDSTLVLKFRGVKGLGLYAMAIVASQAIELVSASLTQICYPRMAEEYGRTGSLRATAKLIYKPLIYISLAYIPFVIAAWLLAPYAIRFLLPKYVQSINAVQWTCVASSTLVLAPMNLIFIVVKRLHLYLVAIVSGMAAYLVSVLLFAHRDAGLSLFPKSLLIGRVLFFVVCAGLILYLDASKRYERGSTLPATV